MTDPLPTLPTPAGGSSAASLGSRRQRTPTHPRGPLQAEKLNLLALLRALQAAGVATAVVSYSGGGDEGGTTGTALLDAQGQAMLIDGAELAAEMTLGQQSTGPSGRRCYRRQCLGLVDALEAFAYDASVRLHGDWFDNDGADGEVTINVAGGTALVVHDGHYIATDRTETVL